MLVLDHQEGKVAVASAANITQVGEGVICIGADAVYIHPGPLTREQGEIVRRGLRATLDEPGALEDLKGSGGAAGIDLPPRDAVGVDGDGVCAAVGEGDRDGERVPVGHVVGDVGERGGAGPMDGQRRGAAEVKGDVECFGVAGHGLSFLRRVWRVLHGVSHPNAAGKDAYVAEVRR